MRFDGHLQTWHDDRGFGFVSPTQGGQEIFIHISAFPGDGTRPKVGEPLSFEIELNRDGRKRAANVRRPAQVAGPVSRPLKPARYVPYRTRTGWRGKSLVGILLIGIVGSAYDRYSGHASPPRSAIEEPTPAIPAFEGRCDGRTHCSQMTSCAEATFFLRNCPGVKMDGNHDGVPCEQQWCTGLNAR
jgi:cold shock CspA family protein